MNAEATEVAVEVEDKDQAARNAFNDAVIADKTEDEVKMAIISTGVTFKDVTRLYKKFMIESGLSMSKEDKDAVITKALSKAKNLGTEEGFSKTVAAICEAGKGVTEKSAAASIRSWAKAQDPVVECWAKPKSANVSREGFRSRFYDALVANPNMTKEECHEYLVNAEGTSSNVMKHESNYQGMRGLANRIQGSKAA
jgi:hypothetical protein